MKEQACASSWASLQATLEPESGTEYNKKRQKGRIPMVPGFSLTKLFHHKTILLSIPLIWP